MGDSPTRARGISDCPFPTNFVDVPLALQLNPKFPSLLLVLTVSLRVSGFENLANAVLGIVPLEMTHFSLGGQGGSNDAHVYVEGPEF